MKSMFTSIAVRLSLLQSHLYLFSVLLLMMLGTVSGYSQTNSYLGLNGGFEGEANVVNVTTNASPVATNWTKSTATATIANETATVRSGVNSLKVTSNSATLCRVFSPLMTVTASTTAWQVQYYRRAANTTNTVQNQSANYRGGVEQSNGVYSSVAAANTWEKVTYSPTTTTSATSAAANILVQQKGTGGDMFYDDFVLYESATVDVTAPSSATAVTVGTATTSNLTVGWTAASGGVDGGGYMVVRYATNPNADNDPNANGIYAVGNTITNGTGSLVGTVRFVGTGTSFVDSGLTAGVTYYYKVYSYDKAYNYAAEAQQSGATLLPSLTSFTPSNGCSGTSIVITGTNFNGATAVTFGGTAATSFTVNSNTQITAVVGAGTSGDVAVTVAGVTTSLSGFTTSAPYTPTVSAGGSTTICSGSNVVLTATLPASVTDLSFTTSSTGTNGTDQWQSFVPTILGATTAIQLNKNGSGIQTGTFSIYSGVGVSGTLLHSQSVTTPNSGGAFILTLPNLSLLPGNSYTFRWQGTSLGLIANSGTYGTYFSSTYGTNPSWRLNFITTVVPTFGSYQWYNNSSAIGGATSATYTATTAGVYTIMNIVSGCNSAASNSSTVIVNALPYAPAITAGGSTTICSGNNVVLTAAVPASVTDLSFTTISTGVAGTDLWQSFVPTVLGTTSAIQLHFNGIQSVTGTFSIYSGVGIAGTLVHSQSVTTASANNFYTISLPNLNLTPGNDYTFRWQGASLSLIANSGTYGTFSRNGVIQPVRLNFITTVVPTFGSYQWYNNSSAIGGATSATYAAATAGVYTAMNVVSGCNSAASNSSTVTVNALPATPTISAGGPTTFCSGGNVVLTSSVGTSYLWSTGATTQSITVSTSGSYTVRVTNANGCQSAASTATAITVNSLPTAPTISAGGSTTFCSGGSVVLSSSTGTGNLWSTGETTQSITVSTSGSYTVRFTNANGCQSAASTPVAVTVNALPATPTIGTGGSTTFCSGGSVVLISSTGTSYLWSNGATTQNITVSTAGSYTVRVTNANGCQSAASLPTTVTVNALPARPTITASGSTTICSGSTVVLTSSAATGYLWSNGATTQSITVATAGNYTVTVTNSNGCQSLVSLGTSVSVNALPSTPTITAGGSTTFCSGGNVVLTSSVGTSYLWSTGATTQSITASTSGSYTVRVTNASGCQSAASIATAVTVNALPSTPTITAGGSTTFCSGSNVILTSSVGTSYLWSSGATTQSTTVSSAGSYTVRVTDANGCQSPVSSAIATTVNPSPTASISGNTEFCAGGTSTLIESTTGVQPTTGTTSSLAGSSATGSVSSCNCPTGYVAVGYQGNVGGLIDQMQLACKKLNPDGTLGSAVVYTCVNGTSDGGGAVGPYFLPGDDIMVGMGAQEGSGFISTMTAQGHSYAYIMANGQNSATPSVATTLQGAFAFSNLDPVFAPDGMVVTGMTFSDSDFFVSSISLKYTSLANFQNQASFLWSNGATTQSTPVSTAGNYTVAVTNSYGCTVTSAPVSIIVNPTPTPAISGTTSICAGGTTTLTESSVGTQPATGSTDFILSAPVGDSYSSCNCPMGYVAVGYQGRAGGFIDQMQLACKKLNPDGTLGSSVVYTCTNGTSDGGDAVGPYFLPGNDIMVGMGAQAGSGFISTMTAQGQSYAYIMANGQNSATPSVATTLPGAFAFSNLDPVFAPDGMVVTGMTFNDSDFYVNSISLNYTSLANFQNQASFLWSNGETTQSIAVNSAGTYTVAVTNSSGCTGTSAPVSTIVNPNPTPTISGITSICSGSATVLDAGSGYSSYLWSNGATTQTISVTTAGTYTVTVTNEYGCSGTSASVSTTVNPVPTPTITGATSYCEGSSTTLDAGSGYASYMWSIAATTQTISASTAGSYNVTVTNGYGCSGTSAAVTITVNPNPTPTITGATSICSGNSTILDAGSGYSSYNWSTGATTQTISASAAGSYTVTVANANGCSGTSAPITITVNPTPNPTISGATDVCVGGSANFCVSPIPAAQSVYALNSVQSYPSDIALYDTNLAVTSLVRNYTYTGPDLGTQNIGLDRNPLTGQVYLITNNSGRRLYTIDLATNAMVDKGLLLSTTGSNQVEDFTFDNSGTMYAVFQGGIINTINYNASGLTPTAFAVSPSLPSSGAVGLTYDFDNNQLIYATSRFPANVYRVNLSTGLSTYFGQAGSIAQAIEYVGSNRAFVSGTFSTNSITTLDFTSGNVSNVLAPTQSFLSIKDLMYVPGATVSWTDGVTNLGSSTCINFVPAGATTVTVTTTNAFGCSASASVTTTVIPLVTPTFAAISPICVGTSVSPLPTTSNNGITGTWSPAFNNTATTTYTFTPNPGQCGTTTTLTIDVTSPPGATLATAIDVFDINYFTTGNNRASNCYISTKGYPSPEVWYKVYVSPCSTKISVNTCAESYFDTALKVYAPDGNTLLADNNDGCDWLSRIDDLDVSSYGFVYVLVEGASNSQGDYGLTITQNVVTTATFPAVSTVCVGSAMSPLPTRSNEGVYGTWSPALNNTQTTIYTFTPTVNNCITPVTVTIPIIVPVGDSSVYGNNEWNVYAWNSGGNFSSDNPWITNYSGYYTASGMNFNTQNQWLDTPSDAPGYQGCPVNVDLHSWSAKRQGFPTNLYSIDINGHDDSAELYINGVLVWDHQGCCDAHGNVWQGFLGANDQVDFRATEGVGGTYGQISFNVVVPTITSSSSTSFCSGGSVILTSSPTPLTGYLWSNGATTQSITVAEAGDYSVQFTSTNFTTGPSQITTVVVNPNPVVSISGSSSICLGDSVTLTADGASTYSWETNTTIPLDLVGNASLAIGLHKLKTSYSGPAIRLRRSTDNVQADFGFSGNNLDIGAISGWLNGATGYCVTLYDQSGNGGDVGTYYDYQQPTIVLNGYNGRPVLHFNTSQFLVNFVNYQTSYTAIYGARQTGGTRGRVLSSVYNNWLLGYWNGAKSQAYFDGWVTTNPGTPAADDNYYIYSGASDGVTSQLYENGTLLENNSGGVSAPTGIELNGLNGSETSDVDFTDVMMFSSVLSDTNRSIVENSIRDYYSQPTTQSITVTPTASTTYTVTGYNAAGCSSTASINVAVNTNCSSIVNLKLNIEGYYDTATSSMRSVKNNQDYVSPMDEVEDLTIELRDAQTYEMISSTVATLHTDGTLSAAFAPAISGSYYIAVKGSNMVQTWSALPQTVGAAPLTYDFTTDASQAYGNNMNQVEAGVFACFSGDVDQNGNLDTLDYTQWEVDYNNFASGVFATDLDGNGNVDTLDYTLWEINYNNFVSSLYPTAP